MVWCHCAENPQCRVPQCVFLHGAMELSAISLRAAWSMNATSRAHAWKTIRRPTCCGLWPAAKYETALSYLHCFPITHNLKREFPFGETFVGLLYCIGFIWKQHAGLIGFSCVRTRGLVHTPRSTQWNCWVFHCSIISVNARKYAQCGLLPE